MTKSSACSSRSADSSDGRLPLTAPVFAASELAQRFGLYLRGPDRDVAGVGTLADATPGQLGFLANPRYRTQLAETRAGVVVLAFGFVGAAGGAWVGQLGGRCDERGNVVRDDG